MDNLSNIKEVNSESFEHEVSEGTSIVDFWAPWCMPCQMQGVILEKMSGKLPDSTKVLKLDVDQNMEVASKFGINTIPTLLVFKNGEMIHQFVGVQDEDVLMQAVNETP